ncbi:beta/gamma crystallin domain-containing protein 1 [Pseudorasbora parva]|uniref:beta/gamma crystallin domain-containing protein 1 n=1 Tax=Pseudorasbora parva TaxID=51549 RepID=UPI00351F7D19
MGRRRSGRKRRSSNGDVGGAQTKSPTNTQPDTTSLATSPQTACADSAFEEAEVFLECSGAEAPNSGSRENVVRAEWLEGEKAADSQNAPNSADLTSVADSNMDEEPVVRMTESAESKRRSMKVSHSEKFFAKKVVVTSEAPDEDHNLRLKSTSEPKLPRSDERARCPEDRVDGTNVKTSHQKGRIADKINLFEKGTNKPGSSTNMRHLDISPARNVAVRLAEHGGMRPGSALQNRSVKERAMDFNAGGEKIILPSGHPLSERQLKTAGRTEPQVKPKPIDQTDSKSHNATQSKPALSEGTSDSNIGNKDLFCSVLEVSSPSDETPPVKSPNRTSSRSKRRRSKDTIQPLSPTSKNKQDKEEVKSNIAPKIPLKPLPDAENTTDQSLTSTSGEEFASKTPKAGDMSSNTDSKRLQKAPHMDTKALKEIKSKERENREDFASEPLNSQTEKSSDEVNIERLNDDKKQPVQEGEPGENRDTIVNTLFGESEKLDPSVTKDEKPPFPEDLKLANSKDSLVPANSSAASFRKDAMRNRENETGMLVLPEKDTNICVHEAKNTPENDPNAGFGFDERPSKPNYKSKEKDDQSKKHYNITEAAETHKHSNEVNTTEGEITAKTPKKGESKDQSKENDASTSRALATPNPALVKKQNYEMDALSSPQIPPTEGGGPKRGEPQSQSESREEQKTASSKRDLQQQEQKTQDTEKTSLVNGDLNSGETEDQLSVCIEQSGEKILSTSHENTQIPASKDNVSLRSKKKKPSSLPPTANEASSTQSGQASEKIAPKPASTNETASAVPASTNEKATPLTASANEKATPPTASPKATPPTESSKEKATPPTESSKEKATPPTESSKEKATPPTESSKEKAMPPTESSKEMATPPTASAIEKATPPTASANEKATPPTASTKATPPTESSKEKATPPTASSKEKATPPKESSKENSTPPTESSKEKATPPTKSSKEKATPPTASANEKATPPTASSKEKATPLTESSKEKATPPTASSKEKATPPTASANEKATPPTESTNEKATPQTASANEKAMPSTASAKEKATPPTASTNENATPPTASAKEKATPPTASTNEKATPPTESANEKATPPTASANEKATPPTASANEKATPPTASANEKAMPPTASANEKATPPTESANEKATPPTASANEKATPPTASANEMATPPTESANEKAMPPTASANEKATPPTASANEKATPPTESANEKATPPTASANEKATPPTASANEKATPPTESANEKATPPTASANEKATPPTASANKKATPPTASASEKATPPTASANKKATPPTANEKTTPPTASANEKTTPPTAANEKATPPPASPNEKATPPPASPNEKATPPPASTNKKTIPTKPSTKENAPPPATTDSTVSIDKTTKSERTSPLPASSSFPLTSTNGENITPLPSSIEKTVLPPASIKEKTLPPHATSTDPATRKKKFTPKPFFLPQIPSAPGSSSQNRDSPSSWLDVERPIGKKPLFSEPKPKLSKSVGKTNRDTSGEFDPEDFIANVKRLAMPFNLPRRKHNQHRLQVPSVLPAIREDRLEKPFDPDEFKPGLRRRREFILDLAPSSISKSQVTEDTKPKWTKPERESILTRSLIFQRSRKESKQEEGEKEEKVSDESTTEPLKTRSRLERCSIVSILRSPSKGRRMEFLNPTGCPSDGLLSPTDAPGSTPPPQSHLAPSVVSPEQVMVEEVLAKNDGRFTPHGSQVILKPSKDVGPTMTPDPKTTSSEATIVKDTKAPSSDSQCGSQVVLKPAKDDGPTQAPDLKITSTDPQVTHSPATPSCTQSGSQVALKHSKNIGSTMKPDPKTTSTDPTVTMEKDTKAPSSDTQSGSQVVLKPPTDDGPTQAPDLKTTSSDPLVSISPPTPSCTQSGSQVVGPTVTPDLKATSRDQTTTMVKDTKAPSSDSQSGSQVVLKPPKDDGPMQAPDLKTTSSNPQVTNSPATPSCTQSGPQVALKHSKNIGPTMKPDPKTTSTDPTVTMEKDTKAPSSDSQSGSQVVLKPPKEDGPTQAPSYTQSGSQVVGPTMTPEFKATSRDQTDTMVKDTKAPPGDTQSDSQVVLKHTKDDGPTMTPDLKTTSSDPLVSISPPTPSCTQSNSQIVGPTMTPDPKTTSRDPTVTTLTDTNALLHPSGTQTTSQVVLKPTKDDGPSADRPITKLTDTKTPPLPSSIQNGSDVVLQPDGPILMPDLKTTTVDPIPPIITAPPALPSFEDIKLPSLMENFLQKKPETSQSSNKIDPPVARESASIPGLVDLNTAVDVADRKTQEVTIPQVPASQILPANPQRELPNIPTARGIHRRPAKIVIFEHHQFNGQSFEFFRDQPDATQMQLSSVISIKVVRGCWILYEKPGFEGRCIALEEEGVIELPNQWAEEGEETSTPLVIGSIRLAVRDYTPPRIELFTEPTGRGRSSEYVEVTEEVGSFGLPQNTGSIKVHSGLWLVYSDPGFQGLLAVLEAGEYPFPEDWGFPEPIVGSLRPLCMGLPKVEQPTSVKAVLYERAGLQGRCVEVTGDVFSLKSHPDDPGLTCVESLKILGGLWVGYELEGFDGQQFLLEEGEYLDWSDWGGTGQKLLSLRPVLMDFSSPQMKMFSERDFSERGVHIELLEPLENVSDTHFGPRTGSIEVLAGVWVVFEEPGLCGRQYVLEKGLYGSPEDWGSSNGRISSAIPVTLENLEHSCHFQIQLFSEPGLAGTSVVLQDSLPTMPEGFSTHSCRVIAGSWLAFSSECFSGDQCVLEEGVYPDLRTMGFTHTSVLSLQPTGHEFSLPSVVLFERSGLKGRRTLLKSGSVNLQLTDSCTRVSSILVEGGMWVLYEAINFRGSQFLLKPGEVPDWPKLSSWQRIGSLRPLMQKQPLFRLRNEEAGLMMSVTGSLDDIKLMRIQVSEEVGGANQIWAYQDGRLQSKWLPDCCVDVGSGVLMAGSRAVLSSEPGKPPQIWNIGSDGIIRSNAAPHLVLEVKGGQQFDKSQIILNEFHPSKKTQRWSLEII